MKPTLLVLNPNRTAWMTERVLQQVHAVAGDRVALRGLTAPDGPEVIDNRERFDAGAAAAERALKAELAAEPECAGVLLACFGDPGLQALRGLAGPRPVHGLAEAAMQHATRLGLRFAILTSGPAWVPLLAQRAAEFGLSQGLTGVHALPIDGKQFAEDPARWLPLLRAAVHAAEREGAQALILGGAAFAGLRALVDTRLLVIDGIDAATQALLRDLGLDAGSAVAPARTP